MKMKVTAQPKKVKSALGKVSKGQVLKKREKESLGKKEALLNMARESLTTPEKKKVVKSLKQKKISSATTAPTNSFQKATKPSKKDVSSPKVGKTGSGPKSLAKKLKAEAFKVEPIVSTPEVVSVKSSKTTEVNSAVVKSNVKGASKKKTIRKRVKKVPKENEDIGLNEELLEGVCSSALKLLKVSSDSEEKKDLFDSLPQLVYLQISMFKIPETSHRIVRSTLPNSIYTSEPEVCLILPDIVRGRMRDVTFAKFAEQYEDKLRELGVKGIKQIFSFAQLRAEYSQFELKKRLCRTFDVFICDGRIQDHCTHFLAGSLKKANKFLMPVQALVKSGKDFEFYSNLQSKVDNALHKVGFMVHGVGSDYCVPIGHSHLSEKQLADNVQAMWKTLDQQLPGGIKNVRCARLKGSHSLSIPVYASLVPCAEVPVVKQSSKCETVEDEISTLPGYRAVVHPDGSVKLINQQTQEDAQFMKDGSIRCSKRAQLTMANEAAKRLKVDPKVTDVKKGEDEDNEEDEDSNNVNAAELEYLSQWNEASDSDDEDDVPEKKNVPAKSFSKKGAKQLKGKSPKSKKSAPKQAMGISQKLTKGPQKPKNQTGKKNSPKVSKGKAKAKKA